jgi:hypothetical protein
MKSLFYGAWTLLSQVSYPKNGQEPFYPRSADAMGQIMYDVTGCVAVQLMNPHHTFEDLASRQAALEGSLVYFGTFQVDERAGIVTHVIEASTFPAFTQEDQKRQQRAYEFSADGTRLTLTAETETETRMLIWQRIGQK